VSERPAVLVTGATGGIGSAVTARLAAAGWSVFAGVRDRRAGEALAGAANGEVTPVVLDVASEESVAVAAIQVAELAGERGLDGLVNNAGIVVEGPVELLTGEDLRRQFDVNVIGAMSVTRAVLPLLRRAGGRIVNVGAVNGRTSVPYFGASAASKAALAAFNDALRLEVRPFGVEVSIVEPTPVETEIFVKATAAAERSRAGLDPTVRALYEPGVKAVQNAIADGGSKPVDVVAVAVERALTARRPKTRYPVGKQPRLVMGLRFVPDRMRDRLLARELGLSKLPSGNGPA
jgi:NAD(P)-dependent dehydrogenase (short-subunit alcohol dehydrogenase family)